MRELSMNECNSIYGGGVGFGEALEVIIEAITEGAHASEGGIALAEALGAFESEEHVSKYTSDQVVLKIDVNTANSYMHEIQTHTGSEKVTDTMREQAIDSLQNDGRVYYNPLEGRFEALGGTPEHPVTEADLKDTNTHNFYQYIMEQDSKNIHSSDGQTAHSALTSIQNSTREGIYHYDVSQAKFIVG